MTQEKYHSSTLLYLLHFLTLYNKWSRIHAKKCKEILFCVLKVGNFSSIMRHVFDKSKLVLMSLNFEKSGLQTFPTKVRSTPKIHGNLRQHLILFMHFLHCRVNNQNYNSNKQQVRNI